MLTGDARHDADIGAHHVAERGDVARPARPHLGKEDIARQPSLVHRLRDADGRVVGGGRRDDAPPVREKAGGDLFDGRLAETARDAHLHAGRRRKRRRRSWTWPHRERGGAYRAWRFAGHHRHQPRQPHGRMG